MAAGSLGRLREADWLTPQRVRAYALILTGAFLALLANSFFKAMGPDGTDFLAFWGAGQVTAAGDPAAAYDLAVQERVQTATGSTGWFAFVNPPPFLFIVAPFGLLPFAPAWIVWVALTYAAWAWASIRAFPRLWPIVLVFPGALLAAGHAQTGLLTGALLVGGVALMDRRPVVAGLLLGALVIKPHLALLVPFWLAGAGKWRAFLAAGTSAIGLLALSVIVFGIDTMVGYTQSWEASRLLMAQGDDDFHLRMATPYSQLRLAMEATPALAIQGTATLAMMVLAFLAARRFGGDMLASGAAMMAATALASPYLFNYDLPFLILPILWLVREGLRIGFRPWERLLLVSLWFAPYATRALAFPLHLNLMPLAAALLLALVWTRGNRAGAQAVMTSDGA